MKRTRVNKLRKTRKAKKTKKTRQTMRNNRKYKGGRGMGFAYTSGASQELQQMG